jgi:AcrR family transcriptional regulator
MTAVKKKPRAAYHHGDLRLALRDTALTILEKNGVAELSLRAIARKAGVSHAAPYRHYPNHEALLVELALEGFQELRADIGTAAATPNQKVDRITDIGGAYMRFAARQPALAKLMFGPQIPNRDKHSELSEAAEAIGAEIGKALDDHALGLAVWSAVHGLVMLTLDNIIDLGQRRSGLNALPSRAEILLRSLFGSKLD